MQFNFDYSRLQRAVVAATTEAFAQLQTLTSAENLYVFGLYVCREGTAIAPTANTEAGLHRVAQEYAGKYGKSVSLYQQTLRWSPWDWAYAALGKDSYSEVESLLESTWSETDHCYQLEADRVFQVCREALIEIDHQGIFGTEFRRDRLIVGLFKHDQTRADLLAQAKYLNSQRACDRLQAELEQGYAAFFRK